MEIGSLRALMRKHRLWADIQPDLKMPRGREDVGPALSADEEHRCSARARRTALGHSIPLFAVAAHGIEKPRASPWPVGAKSI